MPLLSIEFFIAFLFFFLLYWGFANRPNVQNWLLLIAGIAALIYVNPYFALTVTATSLVASGISYGLQRSKYHRKAWFITGISLAVLNLGFFKYYDFFRPMIESRTSFDLIDILMPLGISYYTFQTIAYFISLYRNEVVQLRWHQLLLHLSFFGTITAGPIFRVGKMKTIDGEYEGAAAQITTAAPRSIIRPSLAVTLILLGIAKKWWLAGTLGNNWVDPVFENPLQYDSVTVLTATYGYTAQLYLDFSGYSDLVIGLAMLLGFQLPPNFKAPFTAHNIRDFWNRWHISLSTWIRDYLYIPLGGSHSGFFRTQLNLFIAMLLSGIWHGYGWNFLLWGALHGMALVLLNMGDAILGKRDGLKGRGILGKGIGIFITVNFVCAAFVVFRTTSLGDAWLVFRALIDTPNALTPEPATLIVLATMATAIFLSPLLRLAIHSFERLLNRLPLLLWSLPICIVLLLTILFAPSGIPGFIYANF